MTSDQPLVRRVVSLAIVAGLLNLGHAAPTWAAETPYPLPSGQAQCATSDINDNANVTGSCVPSNAGPVRAFYVSIPGATPALLRPLVTGQSCAASGITNTGLIVGGCVDANNRPFGVTWASLFAAPVQLAPLSGLLGLGADITTGATAYNQNGAVGGVSVSNTGASTAVLWPSGSGTPILVSSYADNCVPVDVNATTINGRPSVALNCPTQPSPGNPGPVDGAIAQATGLLGIYVVTPLPLPPGATHCTVAAINDAQQAVGTCHFPAQDHPQTAWWASFTSTPQLLAILFDAPNGGVFINSSGHVVFGYRDPNGNGNAGFWDPLAITVTLIPPPSGSPRCASAGLGDNDTVALTCRNGNAQPEAATWTSAGGTVPLGDFGGGAKSGVAAINKAGTAAAINGENSAQQTIPGEASF